MARHYGIPYMGSKQKLVDKIIPFILNRHTETTDFYDLFGGGGSVALYAAHKYPTLLDNFKVHYNELSKSVGGLMEHLQAGRDVPFDFVPRTKFESEYTRDDWYGGLLQTCWTFGNNQRSYLYGMPIEDFKQELAALVMTGTADIKWLEKFANEFTLQQTGKPGNNRIFSNLERYKTPYQRRIVVGRQLPLLGQLQHMSRLERLVQIENMPGINDLTISVGKSYSEVPIVGARPLIYCDPPYEGTAEYREGGFDHKAFYDWVMEQDCPVYVSSYKVSDDRFKLVKAINTRSLLASAYSAEPTYNYENIYWNGVQ